MHAADQHRAGRGVRGAFLTFVFLTWGEFSGTTGITQIGGYLGLLTAVLAWYGSMAGVMNATAKHAVLPVFPRS